MKLEKECLDIKVLDCTLRDGGYYNSWDFSSDLVEDYLLAMSALNVDYVGNGFRTLDSRGLKGGYAYSSDTFLNNLCIPKELKNKIGVMLNESQIR